MTEISPLEWAMRLANGDCEPGIPQYVAACAILGDKEYSSRVIDDTLLDWIWERIPEWQRLGQERPCSAATANGS